LRGHHTIIFANFVKAQTKHALRTNRRALAQLCQVLIAGGNVVVLVIVARKGGKGSGITPVVVIHMPMVDVSWNRKMPGAGMRVRSEYFLNTG
jgi:hypothetical protein